MITPKNIIKHELIGLKVQVIKSSDPTKIGMEGTVVDETMNMLLVNTSKGIKKLSKAGNTFRFWIKGKKVEILGDVLVGRPEERIKKKLNKW